MVITLGDDRHSSIRVDLVFSASRYFEDSEAFGRLVLVLASGAVVEYGYSSKEALEGDIGKVSLLMVADKAYPSYPSYPSYPAQPGFPAPNTGDPYAPYPVIYCDTVNLGNGTIR